MRKGTAISIISVLAVLTIVFAVIHFTNNADKTKQIDVLTADVADKAGQIDTLNTDVKDKVGQIEALNADIAYKAGQIDILKTEIADKAGQIDTLKTEIAEKADQIDILNADVADKAEQIDTLKADVTDKADQIEVLNADVSDKAGQIEALRADITKKSDEIDSLKADIAGKEKEIESLNSAITEKDRQIEALTADLADKSSQDETSTTENKKEDQKEKANDSTVPTELVTIKECGFQIRNGYLVYSFIAHNNMPDKACRLPCFRITARDAEGGLISTTEQTLGNIYPGQDTVYADKGSRIDELPASIEVSYIEPDNDYYIPSPSELDHATFIPFEIKNSKLRANYLVGELYNPNDYNLPEVVVTVIFRDKDGKLLSGNTTFINNVKARETVPFEIYLYKELITESFEVFAQPWW